MFPTINKRQTGIMIRKLMDQYNVTVKQVQEYLGLASVQSVYHWLNGISMPTVDNLYALSELFQLPMDKIVCGNRRMFGLDKIGEMRGTQQQRLYLYYYKFTGGLIQ